MIRLEAALEAWPVAGVFTLARGSRTQSDVITVTLVDGPHQGRGEGAPLARYDETGQGCLAAIAAQAQWLQAAGAGSKARSDSLFGELRAQLCLRMAHGAARNAIDCALWDLEAKSTGKPAWMLAGLPEPRPVVTAFTLGLDTPERMAQAALRVATLPVLKLKLGGEGDLERVRCVRAAAPQACLIVDANEAWDAASYDAIVPALAGLGVALIEQPFPAAQDAWLHGRARPVPVCADESLHDRSHLPGLAGLYDFINIKLDKAGGLTEAIALAQAAAAAGFGIMTGCMVGTSLGMAPAQLLACGARFVDIDGPLLLARDRVPGLRYESGRVFPPPPALWG